MRWLGALALCAGSAACTDDPATLALGLELPHGPLDPVGYTSVEVVVHEPGQPDVTLRGTLTDRGFALGKLAPAPDATLEATLRSDSGAAVGYGRIAGVELRDGKDISIPVRRPIVYLAGVSSAELDAGPRWTQRPATYSDLSTGGVLDGSTVIGTQAVLVVAAGGRLFQLSQDASSSTGALVGAARVAEVKTTDHAIMPALAGEITGEVLDGAGDDAGHQLVIGTTTQLVVYAVDEPAGARTLATGGRFDRVAIVADDAGGLAAVAIKRGASCSTSELWWAPLAGGEAHRVATGGFADVAADRGHAYYIDACTGDLGEVTATAATKLRVVMGAPTALAVSNDQAYIGLASQPATLSLIVASPRGSEVPRVLWTETEQQVLRPIGFPTVQRELVASSVTIEHLEIGAGGDYVALSTTARLEGAEIPQVRFPEMDIASEELRVFDAATGGTVQRYRSACDGTVTISPGELEDWECATIAGQVQAATNRDHHIRSMTFQFGKK